MLNDYSRQMELFDNTHFNTPVHVIGAGASGSWVVVMLAKLGVKNVHIWDFDTIMEHNIPNQCFMINQIGENKASAINNLAVDFGDMHYTVHTEAVTGATHLEGIVFVLTDTMSSRKDIWLNALKLKPQIKLVIETRMGLDMCRIFNINPLEYKKFEKYEGTLYDDSEAEVSACGASKSVITTAITTGAIAVRQMLNWNNGKELPDEIIYDMSSDTMLVYKWDN